MRVCVCAYACACACAYASACARADGRLRSEIDAHRARGVLGRLEPRQLRERRVGAEVERREAGHHALHRRHDRQRQRTQ
eukprot:2416831-Pleurochrysis_carterae.AAC.1